MEHIQRRGFHFSHSLAKVSTQSQVVISIAGQVNKKMLEHYSHIRMKAKKSALEGLEGHGQSRSTQSIGQEEEAVSVLI